MHYKYIKTEKQGYKFILTLARPEKRNAFTPTMVSEVAHAVEEANQDPAIKVLLLKAEGPVFCAGMDLKTFQNPEADVTNPTIENRDISLGEVFDKLTKPSIALIEGDVVAGAFLFVLGCTYAYCNRDVRFRLPELALGIFPMQVMASLLKVMPQKKVLQLCLDTEYFSAAKAVEYGIIDGYLEDTAVLDDLVNSFEEIRVEALQSGIEALRALPGIRPGEQFAYLKSCLEHLRRRE